MIPLRKCGKVKAYFSVVHIRSLLEQPEQNLNKINRLDEKTAPFRPNLKGVKL